MDQLTKIKRWGLCLSIIGGVLLLIGATPIITLLYADTHPDASHISIIGGADLSITFSFLLSYWLDSLYFPLSLIGAALLITGIVLLIGKKTIAAHCRIKTSVTALAFSAFLGVGAFLFWYWLILAFRIGTESHPPQYPYIIIGVVVCFIACLLLLIFYLLSCRKDKQYRRIGFDIGIVFVYTPAFFFIWGYVFHWLLCLFS